ncbi:MAG: CCA tRNA nucleotidyltransferase [Lachnospiraceae bacterium]|nr:CCA tRNA nucleotidyltransferase [Lachnospiraceae bacterium]
MKITIPDNAKFILEKLHTSGYEAYVVGGCVRDSILGRNPADWDITTNASPMEVKSVFKKTVDTGIKHGTVTVLVNREGYEVTTYRIDGEYEDNRHPKEVTFTKSLKEDLKRRDFTINAMAYNETHGLVDLFDGMGDIERKTIRCVGDANERFTEDALRIMRAVRFSAQLGYSIDDKTKESVRINKNRLSSISAERIRVELDKLLSSPNPDFIKRAYEYGIMDVIMPEFSEAFKALDEKQQGRYLDTLKESKAEIQLRLSLFFVIMGENKAQEVLKNLKYDNATKNSVLKVLKALNDYPKPFSKPVEVRIFLNERGEETFKLFTDCFCYLKDSLWDSASLCELKSVYDKIKDDNDCYSMKDLKITGKDLMDLGINPGKEMGDLLKKLLDEVIIDPSLNSKESLVGILKKWGAIKC